MQQAVWEVEFDAAAKPAWEWIAGQAVQKIMPTDWHSFLQSAFSYFLMNWASGHGKVGTEWRFRIPPNDYQTKSLVPDVAYLSDKRYFALPKADRTYPPIAPEIVVEILSPLDPASQVAMKRRVYLWWGVKLVLIVDPQTRTVEAYDENGGFTTFLGTHIFTTEVFPTLSLPLAEIFATIDEPDASSSAPS